MKMRRHACADSDVHSVSLAFGVVIIFILGPSRPIRLLHQMTRMITAQSYWPFSYACVTLVKRSGRLLGDEASK